MNRHRKKQYKHSTSFYNRIKKYRQCDDYKYGNSVEIKTQNIHSSSSTNLLELIWTEQGDREDAKNDSVEEIFRKETCDNSDDKDVNEVFTDIADKMKFKNRLKAWAIRCKIKHNALNELLGILLESGHSELPKDSRTLLDTPKEVKIVNMGPTKDGKFWYHGIKNSLEIYLKNSKVMNPLTLNFNVDGIPIHKSSKYEFWPILAVISDVIDMPPMTIAIYFGKEKPNLQEFLKLFVGELKEIKSTGIIIDNQRYYIKVGCFICDSPARAFIKGTVNFNHKHGCLKCTVEGEYFKEGHHVSFHKQLNAVLRTDESFRMRLDEDHHKEDTPLENLDIDMVQDFVVADALHLLHLGIMKKCLVGWTHGSFNFKKNKFSAIQISQLSENLIKCNEMLPTDIHRAVRGLDQLKFWKGTEFRTFLMYLGPVILKKMLNIESYLHFLLLFCAVRICSSRRYFKYLDLSDKLFKAYIDEFSEQYGRDSIGSNVHNLCHVVNDVKRFGPLENISTYPFENHLGYIKSLLRSGHLPLQQVAMRLIEFSKLNILAGSPNNKNRLFENKQSELKRIMVRKGLELRSDSKNKWFLTNSDEIIAMEYAISTEKHNIIFGKEIRNKRNFFEQPIHSSYLDIYCVDKDIFNPAKSYNISEIKCKLFSLNSDDETVFFPLIHTFE